MQFYHDRVHFFLATLYLIVEKNIWMLRESTVGELEPQDNPWPLGLEIKELKIYINSIRKSHFRSH